MLESARMQAGAREKKKPPGGTQATGRRYPLYSGGRQGSGNSLLRLHTL